MYSPSIYSIVQADSSLIQLSSVYKTFTGLSIKSPFSFLFV